MTGPRRACVLFGLLALVLFSAGGIWVSQLKGMSSPAALLRPGRPIRCTRPWRRCPGAWMNNFQGPPVLWVIPLLTYAAILIGVLMVRKGRSHLAWWLGALGWIGIIGTVFAAMFPFLMPSVTHPSHSLTVWDASSSLRTLAWMLGAAVIFVPADHCLHQLGLLGDAR